MKELTNVAGNVTSFASNVNFLFPSWISCTGGLFKKIQNFSESIFTPKEWFLSKKGPKVQWRLTAVTLNLGLSIVHNQALPLQNIVTLDSIRLFNDAF